MKLSAFEPSDMVSQPLDLLQNKLPSTRDLPSSDETPVDNEGQNLLPNLLLLSLLSLWAERMDWYFGVDMAVYHTAGVNPRVPVVPDAFLSIGVERRKNDEFRPSYAVWEEGWTVPMLTLEMVSHKYNDEYTKKLDLYERMGVLYYVIYNPQFWKKHQHQPFEVYKLGEDGYQLQNGKSDWNEPYWMEEVGLGLGRERQRVGGIEIEVLLWHDKAGNAYPLADQLVEDMRSQLSATQQEVRKERQRAEEERQRAEEERLRAEKLAERLRSLGIDPESV